MFGRSVEEPKLSCWSKTKQFLQSFWRGMVFVLTPIVVAVIILAMNGWKLTRSSSCGGVVLVMATYWVTEAIPLTVTSFIPMLAFPLLGVLDALSTCQAYFTDTVMLFIGSLFLALAIEFSGLHLRLALCTISLIGYSHHKLLFALSFITMFMSMWITNTAAVIMLVPITFAILRVFEEQGMGQIYVYGDKSQDKIPSDVTVCYFCTLTYSSTIGGIGTLVGTGTNLAFKGLLESAYPTAPEVLSFPIFSAFTIPIMLSMIAANYFWMVYFYFGFLRPKSAKAKAVKLSPQGVAAAKRSVTEQRKNLGKMSFYEYLAMLLFGLAMVAFFLRNPQVFPGWAGALTDAVGVPDVATNPKAKFIRDSAPAFVFVMLMFLLPSTFEICKYCTAKYMSELPQKKIVSVLDWPRVNKIMPWGFAFLLGGGFAISTAASASGLSADIGAALQGLSALPPIVVVGVVIIFTVFMTNFASNVAVANVICPVSMQLAKAIKMNPLWLCLASGISASFCFMLPVGTPGNLIVQSACNMPTAKMMVAGSGTTVVVVLITWAFMVSYIKVFWDVDKVPAWAA